jgi:phage tail sheath gpL-like
MLQSITDRSGYLEIVEGLVDEFAEEIEAGATRSLAIGVVGNLAVVGTEPAVAAAASYEGAPVAAVERALNPYDILACSHRAAKGQFDANDPVAARAIATLAADLRATCNGETASLTEPASGASQ